MKKNSVHLGETYLAKVSGNLVPVRIDAENPYGGWNATNTETGRKIRIKSAQRLRRSIRGGTPDAEALERLRAGRNNAPTADACPRSGLDLRESATPEQPGAPKVYDPDRCATPRCKGEPALTFVGKPLCQKCWDRHCAEPSEMTTEGAVPLAEALATSPVAAANEASWECAQPGPDDVGNGDEHEDAGGEPASTGDAGELENADMATKTKKSVSSKKGKGRKGATKAPATPKPKAAAKVEAPAKRKAKAAVNGEAKPKRVSALDAAAQILRSAKAPMRPREIIEAAASKGLWTSPAGKTPHATLDAAMRREINTKGKEARFTIEGCGLFGFNGKAGA